MSSKKFNALASERELFLERARACSKLTLPMVIREKAHSGSSTFDIPYQSTGSRGVSALSSNLLLSLFPAGVPFFRLLVSSSDFEEFGEDAERIEQEVNDSLSDIERTVLEEIEGKNLRSTIFEALKNLLIAGSTLVYVEPEGLIRNYTLEDFVVHRDISGNITDIIIKECISPRVAETLGIEVDLPSEGDDLDVNEDIDLFTIIELQSDGTYHQWQEVNDKPLDIPEIFTKEDLPWLPLRLTKITGESYGRGYVEGVIGDLKALEGLSKAILEASAIAAKTVFFVKPGTTTRAKDLTEAENGDVINGDASDVTTLNIGKGGDLNIALRASEILQQRLSYSFNLLDSTLPTKGATTAYEVSQIVSSLEKVLAGVYAMLSSEFMAPLVNLIIKRLEQNMTIHVIPPQVKLIISTGVSALGRSSDIERIMQFAQLANQVSPEAYAGLLDHEKALRELEAAIGVSVLKSRATVSQERAAAQAQQAELQKKAEQEQQVKTLTEGMQSPEQQ